MPTLAEQVAAMEAERDALAKREIGVDPMFKQAYEHENGLREYWERRFEEEKQSRLAAESRLASARVEGAREALTRFFSDMRQVTVSDDQWNMLCDLERFRDRKYPAPAAPDAEEMRPAPTPEPEPLKVKVRTDYGYVLHVAGRDAYIDLTPEDCRRIVALGSRPTQTAEG